MDSPEDREPKGTIIFVAERVGGEPVTEIERVTARPVVRIDPLSISSSEAALEAIDQHHPETIVFVALSGADGNEEELTPSPAQLQSLPSLLDGAVAGGVSRFVTITSTAAAEPATPAGACQALAERLTGDAGRRALGLTAGPVSFSAVRVGSASGLGPLLSTALSSAVADGGTVITGPALLDDGSTSTAHWGEDEIFGPGPVTGLWQASLAPLNRDGVVSAISAAVVGDYRPVVALVEPPSPAGVMSVLLSPAEITGREHELVRDTLDSGWLAPAGPQLDEFEADLSAWVEGRSVVALSSGTAALHLGLVVLGIKAGDEVVVQTATFAATAFAVRHAGAIPVFCDVDEATGNLDPELLAEQLEARARKGRLPKAVIAVDLYGLCADYGSLEEVCYRYEIPILQDAAESLGSRAQGVAAGAHGYLGVLSFNGNKIITTSGGGALVGPSALVERARKLSTQSREPALHYEHHELGFNYRLSGVLASLGRGQLETLPDRIKRKGVIHDCYVRSLPSLEWFPSGVTDTWNHWLNVALLPQELPPHFVCRRMAAVGVECRPFWKPMHRQPVFAPYEAWLRGPADRWYSRGICLPSGSGLSP